MFFLLWHTVRKKAHETIHGLFLLERKVFVLKRKRKRLKRPIRRFLKGTAAVALSACSLNFISKNVVKVNAEYDPALMLMVNNTVELENQEQTKNSIVVALAESDDRINVDDINLHYSSVSVEDASSMQKGIQRATIVANVVDGKENATVNTIKKSGYIVIEQDCLYPTLELRSSEITIANDGSKVFVPEQYITTINDTSGILPALVIDGTVDVNTDGDYTVVYKAINSLGNSVEKELTVHVKTPQWLIEQREAEERARIEAERKAEEERKAKEEAERQAQLQAQLNQQQTNTSNLGYYGGGANPYPGGWSNCTYGAWQALYNARGISLPNFGNAYQWGVQAAAMGYATGMEPAVGSIAVYTNHVAYVDAVDGNMVHIVEGGYEGHYCERWVPKDTENFQALRCYIYP